MSTSFYVYETQYEPKKRGCGMRKCFQCDEELPPGTEHFVYENDEYCTYCIQAKPYTAYIYELGGEFIGLSENHDVQHIEEYEDEYEVEE